MNATGNDATITRFGWKAQNKSLLIFAGEAYNVEQGVASEMFPNERSAVAGCILNGSPEDATNLLDPSGNLGEPGTKEASDMSSDVDKLGRLRASFGTSAGLRRKRLRP